MIKVWPLCVLAMLAAACGSASPDATAAATASTAVAPATTAGTSAGPAQSVTGTPATNLPKVAGAPQQNDILRVAVTEAGFFPAGGTSSVGRRYYTVGLRGISRSDSGQLMGASKGDVGRHVLDLMLLYGGDCPSVVGGHAVHELAAD